MFPIMKIFGIEIPTYFIWMSVLGTYGGLWTYVRSQRRGMNPIIAMDLYLIVILLGPLFARVMFFFWDNAGLGPLSARSFIRFWEGGFTYFGGLIGSLIASVAYLKLRKQNVGDWLDFFTPVLSLGYALGRLGCFWAGCCFGRACDLPWAVQFPSVDGIFRHPTQLYSTFAELILFYVVWLIDQRSYKLKVFPLKGQVKLWLPVSGQLFALWIFGHGWSRVFIEQFRDDPRGHLLWGQSISVWIGALLGACGIVTFLALSKRNATHSRS